MAKRWYVIQTKSNEEDLAVKQLKNQRFKIFYPVYIKTSKIKGKTVKRVLPLFPSYLFVQFDIKRNKKWKKIKSTRGVRGLLGCSEANVVAIPHGCIEAILSKTNKLGVVSIEECITQIIEFLPEMRLEIDKGPLAGMIATYCNHSEKRVFLLLSLLNRQIKISLPLDAVKPVSSKLGSGGSIQNP